MRLWSSGRASAVRARVPVHAVQRDCIPIRLRAGFPISQGFEPHPRYPSHDYLALSVHQHLIAGERTDTVRIGSP